MNNGAQRKDYFGYERIFYQPEQLALQIAKHPLTPQRIETFLKENRVKVIFRDDMGLAGASKPIGMKSYKVALNSYGSFWGEMETGPLLTFVHEMIHLVYRAASYEYNEKIGEQIEHIIDFEAARFLKYNTEYAESLVLRLSQMERGKLEAMLVEHGTSLRKNP